MLQSASRGGAWSPGGVCLVSRRRGVCLVLGGVCSGGVPGPRGVCSGGVCLVPGCAWSGGVSQHALRQTPSPHPVDRILDTRLWKYYLGPTSLRPVNICFLRPKFKPGTDACILFHRLSLINSIAVVTSLVETSMELLVTARKRSLRRFCFHRCLSVHGGEYLSWGSLSRGGLCHRGLCPGEVSVQGGLCQGRVSVHGVSVHGWSLSRGIYVQGVSVHLMCKQCASYWNAFLFLICCCRCAIHDGFQIYEILRWMSPKTMKTEGIYRRYLSKFTQLSKHHTANRRIQRRRHSKYMLQEKETLQIFCSCE